MAVKKIPIINDRGMEVVAVHYLTTQWKMEYGKATELIKLHGWEKIMRECEKIEEKKKKGKGIQV